MNFTLKLIVVPAVIALTLSLSAAELNPSDKINPSEAAPTLNNQPQKVTLKLDENTTTAADDINAKSKPSWWSWFTNTSKKPAYFHYIDVIELLG